MRNSSARERECARVREQLVQRPRGMKVYRSQQKAAVCSLLPRSGSVDLGKVSKKEGFMIIYFECLPR